MTVKAFLLAFAKCRSRPTTTFNKKPPKTSFWIKIDHFNPSCKSAGLSAASGMLLQKCRAFPQSADCSRKSAGRFRSQRIVPAKVQDVSAVSGLFLQKCRAFPLTSEASRKSAGDFPSLKNHQNPPFLPFYPSLRTYVCIKKPCCSIFGTTGLRVCVYRCGLFF